MPTLSLALCLGANSSSFALLAPAQPALYVIGTSTLVGLCWLVARSYGLWRSPLARFLGLGALFALVPMCASDPADRLLLTAEIGFSPLMAMLLVRVLAKHRLRGGWLAGSGKALAGLIMLVHLVIFPLQTVAYASVRKQLTVPSAVLDPLSVPDARKEPDARVVLLNPPVGSIAAYYPTARRYYGVQNPRSMHALAHGLHGLKLTVIDARTIELHSPQGKGFLDNFTRDVVTHPFKIGEVMPTGPMRVTVTALTPQGKPETVRFQFNDPMNQAPWRFYVWTDTGYEAFTMPPPGHTVSLAAPDLARTVMRQLKGEDPRRQPKLLASAPSR
jgi:hypothetical protein